MVTCIDLFYKKTNKLFEINGDFKIMLCLHLIKISKRQSIYRDFRNYFKIFENATDYDSFNFDQLAYNICVFETAFLYILSKDLIDKDIKTYTVVKYYQVPKKFAGKDIERRNDRFIKMKPKRLELFVTFGVGFTAYS